MRIKFGVGIENEMGFSFTDRFRKNFGYNTDSNRRLMDTRWWKKETGWTRTESGAYYYRYHDGTVSGGGFEIQTTRPKSINQKPKDVIEALNNSLLDAAKRVKSNSNTLPFVIPNPFGMNVATSENAPGSFHLNITLPYDEDTISTPSVIAAYNKKLFRGLKVFRAIEPLLVAMVGGTDFNTVGQPKQGEGSSRTLHDSYGNLGNVPLQTSFWNSLNGNGGGSFKFGQSSPPWRRLVRTKYDARTSDTSVGDIVIKNYNNVAPRVRTIELRVLDPFFVPNVYEVFKVIIAALEHGSNVGDIEDGRGSSIWNKATAELMMEGWNTRIPKEYIRFLNEKLDLGLEVKEGKRADLVFDELSKKLWEKNKRGFWVKHLFDEYSPPKVLKLNRFNWDAQFRYKYVSDAAFKKYVDNLLAVLHKVNASNSAQWIKVNDSKSKKVTVRDIIIDDPRFGVDMATEDFEDMLFMFERANIVELKVNSLGHIDKIKMIGQPLESMKKIDNLKTIEGVEETYFGEHVTEVEEQVTEPEPAPTETPRAGRVVSTATTDSPNIDMGELQITMVPIQEESELDYNITELQHTFQVANFIAPTGRPFVVKIYAANIRYQSRRLNAFWIQTNDVVKLYLDATHFNVESRLTQIVDRLSQGMYSPRSVQHTNNFMPDLTNAEFFNRLRTVAGNEYDKAQSAKTKTNEKIQLNAAGIEMLKKHGIRIISLSRGKQYLIANKAKYQQIKNKHGVQARLVKYIPYQKKIYVQKEGNTFQLIGNGKILDKVVGGQK